MLSPQNHTRVPAFDRSLARMIDHTLLKPEATPEDVDRLCAEARTYEFASVCIQPSFVSRCKSLLKGSPVKVCTVIGFPLGATSTTAKAAEAAQALHDGAEEVDMVIHVGMLKAGNNEYVRNDVAAVVREAHARGALVKVIIETALLTDGEKTTACRLAHDAGADFVKTSTGFSRGGATVDDVALMRRVVGPSMGVKAAGGIRTQEQARALIGAGATRIGASASIQIVTGAQATVPTT